MSHNLDTNQDVMDTSGGKGGNPRDLEYLRAYRTADSVTIPKEVFERINPTAPQPRAVLRTVFGNPFPMPLIGFLMASLPLGCTLMGWRGAGGNGQAFIGAYYFFGGMMQIIGGTMEWIIGNTFPFVVFTTFGAFWLTFGTTLTPWYAAETTYVKAGASAAAQLAGEEEYYSTYAFFNMTMGIMVFGYLIASVRTNIALVITFLFIDLAFWLLSGTFWVLAEGRDTLGGKLEVAAGASVFVFCMSGFYVWFSLIFFAVDFPLVLPLGDLSKRFPAASDRKKKQVDQNGTHDENAKEA